MNTVCWRFIDEGSCDGAYNMATDQAMLQACSEGKVPPTLRLYGWKRPTLSIGYSQNKFKQIDWDRCRNMNIPIVRRPTGGRAILHDRELTYSVIASTHHPRFQGGLRETFQTISDALLVCLGDLGIPENHRAAINKRRRKPREIRTPACFASFNHFEIAVRNKKLVGSAQRRIKNAFLQHGSVLIDLDRELFNSLLLFDSEKARRANLELLTQATTTLNEVCGREIQFEAAKQAFRDGFSRSFGDDLVIGELTAFELEWRQRLLDSRSQHP